MKTDFPPQGFKEAIRYDPETGRFHHLKRTHGYGGLIVPGDPVGTIKDGYTAINYRQTIYRAHRLAWWIMTGEWLPADQDIDHINGDRADNRWANLRLATRSQNNMNATLRSDNKSGFRGVSWRRDTQKWHARIKVEGKTILLGNFSDLNAAAAARLQAEEKYFGERSFLNRRE